jgi:hypothetical protein
LPCLKIECKLKDKNNRIDLGQGINVGSGNLAKTINLGPRINVGYPNFDSFLINLGIEIVCFSSKFSNV